MYIIFHMYMCVCVVLMYRCKSAYKHFYIKSISTRCFYCEIRQKCMESKLQVMLMYERFTCISLSLCFLFCVRVTVFASSGSVSPCCCLVKAASSGGGLVVTSGSLIKWIWFLRGNSRPLSPGARPTLVSI